MSRENVALFIKAANKKQELLQRIANTDKTADWVEIAKNAGYQFTAAEFAGVVSDALGKKISISNAVREYMMAQNIMVKGELNQRAIAAVVGIGMAAFVLCNPLFVRGGSGPGTNPMLDRAGSGPGKKKLL